MPDDPAEDRDRRPRRREREDYDRDDYDRPRRRRARNAEGAVMALGAVSLAKGIMALISSLIPCVGAFAIGLASISLLLGVAGIVVARQTKSPGIGLPIAGTVVSGLAVAFSIMWFVIGAAFLKGVQEVGEEAAERHRQQQVEEREAIRTGPATKVTATELIEAYDDNAVNADARFKGTVLEITGQVLRISDRGVGVVVELQSDENGSQFTVECEFRSEDRNELNAIRPKQTATIRGRCRGRFFRNISVADCVLVQ